MAVFLAVALEGELPLAFESGEQLLAQSWGPPDTTGKVRRIVDWIAARVGYETPSALAAALGKARRR
jgi:hypothetical protein